MAGSIEGHVLCVIVCERKAGQWLDGRQPFPYREAVKESNSALSFVMDQAH